MSATTLEDVGLELHELLARLEPARWRDDLRDELAEHLDAMRLRVEAVSVEATRFSEVAPQLRAIELALDEAPTADDVRERWMEFREALHARYEGLAVALQACHVQLPSLRPTNYVRSLTHVAFGALALAFIEFVPWSWAQLTIFSVTGLAWFLEITRRFSPRWNDILMWGFGPIAHPHERYHVNSSTWYATALSLLALVDVQIACVCAVVTLGFGDPAAAVVGRKFGRVKLVNNRTLEGTATFALVSAVLLFATLFGFHRELGLFMIALVALSSAVAGALAELFSRRLDDNFTIPLVSGAVAWALLL